MTSSLLGVRRGSQEPRVARYPAYSTTAAEELIDLAEMAGLVLDDWQKFVLRHGLGELETGHWSAFMIALWVARQNGKGAIIEALELAWLFLFGERLVLHSAHEYKTAQEGFLRIKQLIESCGDLDRRVNRYWQANGEQGIELIGGQRLRFVARSNTSGRGFSGDKNVLDEAQELTIQQMAALLPTMSARPNPQVWLFGTPPEAPDAWAYNVYEAGEEGTDPRLAHFDWGLGYFDPDDPAALAILDDVDARYAANPALGIRIAEDYVAGERRLLGSKFAHERLGMWLPRARGGNSVITEELWRELATGARERPAQVAFAIDINPARTHSAILAVGPRADGRTQLSVADYRPGTHWVVERIADLKRQWNPVAIGLDVKGPGGSLLLELEKAGIRAPADPDRPQPGDLAVPSAGEAAAAYGLFVDRARQKQLVHLDEAPLNLALAGAKTRALAGGSAWDRKGNADICPLVAATVANWAYEVRAPLVNQPYDALDNIW